MDNLEKFIKTNRIEFDTEMPANKVWLGVEANLSKKQSINDVVGESTLTNSGIYTGVSRRILFNSPLIRIAAAIALLVIGTFIGIIVQKKFGASASEDSGTPLASDLKKAEKFYDSRIKSDMIRLAAFKTDSIIYFDLRQIDAVQEELRLELQQAPLSSQTEIIQSMIQNYQIKADILEKVLQQVEKNPNQFINKDSMQHESI